MLNSGNGYVNVKADVRMNLRTFTLLRFFHLVQFVTYWHIFFKLIPKGLYRSSENEKDSRCLAFTSSAKREIRHFQVVVVQRRQRHRQKSVMHVQSCCFVYLNDFLV